MAYRTFHEVCAVIEDYFSSGEGDGHIANRFFCGNAPTSIDFAFCGMFYQAALDKIPSAILTESYPHVVAWVLRMGDSSGLSVAPVSVTSLVKALDTARTYLPFMAANAARLSANPEDNDMFRIDIFDGDIVHRQRPSGYQAKCWQWLHEGLAVALQSNNPSEIAALRDLLGSTGCGALLTTD